LSTTQEVPVLSKIPYVDRLFRNTSAPAIERVFMMVTPRIIKQEEEEEQKLGIGVTR
jgi:general secretion pathway protein D